MLHCMPENKYPGNLVPEALCEAKEMRGEFKEEPLVTSVNRLQMPLSNLIRFRI
jgi:hypothetical protein